jgi:hypothetical protein
MKNLILIFLLLLSSTCFSQTKLDSLILTKVNEYRLENGLEGLHFTSVGQCVSENQVDYMVLSGCVNHEQIEVVDDFIIEPDYAKRNFRCGVDTLDSNTAYMEVLSAIMDTTNLSMEEIATKVVEGWKKSEGHNFAILLPMIEYVGISSKVGFSVKEYYENLYTGEVIMVVTNEKYWFVSLNAYNKIIE